MATFIWTTRFNNIAPQIVLLLALAFTGQVIADEPPGGDELPPALQEAIQNPAIPMIVDATITRFNEAGAAEIKVNRIYRSAGTAGRKVKVPKTVRGYAMDGAEQRIVPLSVITDKGKTRFLFFLDGDLLYSTYNNRFQIRADKKNQLTVDTGRGWKPLKEIVALIPKPTSNKN